MHTTYFNHILDTSTLLAHWEERILHFSTTEQEICKKALTFATEKHESQKRDEGTPYISHCIFASILAMDHGGSAEDVMTLLLHDTLEDTATSFQELHTLFGNDIALNVRALSHKEEGVSLSIEDYIQRLRQRPHCLFHKACDRLANLYSCYVQPKRSKKVRIIESTETHFFPMLTEYPELVEDMRQVIGYVKAHPIIPKHIKLRIKALHIS